MDSKQNKIILDLCGGTGAWSKPYREAGYKVFLIDLEYTFDDVRLLPVMKDDIYGILAAPPCTHLAGSGARWWKAKGMVALKDGLSIVDACLRAVVTHEPHFWCLENPVGRLTQYLGAPEMYFNPCDYGDPYTKKTCLWGCFNHPETKPVEPEKKNRIHYMSPGKDRSKLRSITPSGFARAFFKANP